MSERREFQAEVKQLLDLMVHSLYSNHEVFLRELISNASDALDKRRLVDPGGGGEAQIVLEVNREQRTLSVIDNGIGMSREEVVHNIGTIARSGTKEFLQAVREAQKQQLPPELIGQFGVGFYSAFMVADRVALTTRKVGEAHATSWESTGDGSYTIGEGERADTGTTVTLHLKAAGKEDGDRDFTDSAVIKEIVKRYSDFVAHPIRLESETLNSMKAIWDRPKGEVSDAEYKQFYRHIAHEWTDPVRTIPIRIEGTLEAYALLYLPSKAPFDLYSPEMKRGVQLYVKRVFVMDECRDLMPPWLRFVKGVVDAHDLSLNVSREMLQRDRQIPIIRKQLVKKVLATLDDMKRESRKEYVEFWAEFGPVVKEGLLAPDDHDKLLDLVVTPSTSQETTSLAEYVSRMKEGQEAIYFLAGASREATARSPLLESFTQKGYEVLLFSDPLDDLWLEREPKFQDRPLKSIARGDIKLGSEEERKQAAATLEEQQKQLGDLLSCFRVHLQDEVKEVRLSSRLTSSPVCLVGDEHDLSPRVARMLEQLGQKPPKVKRILEVNPSHPLVARLQAIFAGNNADPRLPLYAKLLLAQAHLAESGIVPDPGTFSTLLGELMTRAAGE
jgi:molecular chaperone HtpG